MNKAVLSICLLMTTYLSAQLPSTNIYSLDLRANEQKVLLNNLKYLTDFNPAGYNNQPYFLDDNTLLITSDFESKGLTDILELDLAQKKISRFTLTEESEYSAIAMHDAATISVVRQELDDTQPVPQLLWGYPVNKDNFGRRLVDDLDNIGYYSWVTKDKVALFLVGETAKLILYDTRLQTQTPITDNIGRCLKTTKSGLLYYVKNEESTRVLMSYDIYIGRSRRVMDMTEVSQDFEILPNGFVITSKGAKLLIANPGIDQEWIEVIDLTSTGIKNISRIASTFGKIAIVTSE